MVSFCYRINQSRPAVSEGENNPDANAQVQDQQSLERIPEANILIIAREKRHSHYLGNEAL